MTNFETKNTIPADQNAEQGQTLLKARQQCFSWATRLQIAQIVFTVLVPMIAAAAAIIWPTSRPFVATIALFVLLIDTVVLDRLQKEHIKDAAKHAEEFDCFVLKLPWNDFLCGPKHPPEKTARAATAYPGDPQSLLRVKDWYPVVVGDAPIEYARLACQRSNLWYDAELRGRYSNLVLMLPTIVFVVFLTVGIAGNLRLADIVLSIAVPATPILIWSFRERFRHADTARSQQSLMSTAEGLWEDMKTSGFEPSTLLSRSREFQDAIFQARRSSPLIFPFIYKFFRASMEKEMNFGAAERLQELRSIRER